LLNEQFKDEYYNELKTVYNYLKTKFKLEPILGKQVQFFRLRPNNFPTIRLSQLANLYFTQKNLFSKIMDCDSVENYYKLFQVKTSAYWENHFTFGKTSISKEKRLTKNFINLLLINTIIPLKFLYLKNNNNFEVDVFFKLLQQLKAEQNTTIKKFSELKFKSENALDTQALIELKTQYCNQHKCLGCSIGKEILTT
ncbi:MAG TPA: DUF2851 family protein, partial [Flavobacteriaceae bacterium]|nr:DUF2851 family protein [Flavobacteriaceae bacterium]